MTIKSTDITFSLDTNAYAAGDVLADTQVLTAAFSRLDGNGRLVAFSLYFEDDPAAADAACRVVLLKSNVSLGSENAAVSITDANARNILHEIELVTNDVSDFINSRQIHWSHSGRGIPVQGASGTRDLYVGLIVGAGAAPTYTSSGIRGTFHIEEG